MRAFHFDIQTLLAAQALVCLVFATGLYVLSRRFPQVKGTPQLALAFLGACGAASAFLARGYLHPTLTLICTYSVLMVAEIFFYYGVDTLLGIRPRLWVPSIVCILLFFPLMWFTAVHDSLPIRASLFTVANCVPIIYLMVDLAGYPFRRAVVFPLIGSLGLYTLSCIMRDIAVAEGNLIRVIPVEIFQPLYLAVGVFSACGLGIFSMMLIGSEVAAIIEHNALRDPLTDSFNRRGIEELLKTELERMRRSSHPLSILLIDIDHFKSINDSAGHAIGDDTLRAVAASITSHLRHSDACGRMGGDEFLVLLSGSHASNAAQICERILHQVAALPNHPAVVSAITVSIGFTESTPGDTPDTILARADRALYSAKRDGRNCAHMDLVLHQVGAKPVAPTTPVRTSKPRSLDNKPPSTPRDV